MDKIGQIPEGKYCDGCPCSDLEDYGRYLRCKLFGGLRCNREPRVGEFDRLRECLQMAPKIYVTLSGCSSGKIVGDEDVKPGAAYFIANPDAVCRIINEAPDEPGPISEPVTESSPSREEIAAMPGHWRRYYEEVGERALPQDRRT